MFWSRFAHEKFEVEGATVLENRNLPFLEVNAGYPTRPEHVPALDAWFASRGRPGVLIVPEGSGLKIPVSNARFEGFGSFSVLEIVGDASLTPQVWVEQVPWSLGRAVGEIIAVSRGANVWAELISTEVARVMQVDSGVTAYLAYHADQPVGTLLEAAGSSFVWGVTGAGASAGAAQSLVNRAALDAGGRLEIAVQDAKLEDFVGPRVLGRYDVWVKS